MLENFPIFNFIQNYFFLDKVTQTHCLYYIHAYCHVSFTPQKLIMSHKNAA